MTVLVVFVLRLSGFECRKGGLEAEMAVVFYANLTIYALLRFFVSKDIQRLICIDFGLCAHFMLAKFHQQNCDSICI